MNQFIIFDILVVYKIFYLVEYEKFIFEIVFNVIFTHVYLFLFLIRIACKH